jgi:hypothetical protein
MVVELRRHKVLKKFAPGGIERKYARRPQLSARKKVRTIAVFFRRLYRKLGSQPVGRPQLRQGRHSTFSSLKPQPSSRE